MNFDFIIFITFIIVAIVSITESIMLVIFSKWYFQKGINIYKNIIHFQTESISKINVNIIEDIIRDSKYPSLKIKMIGSNKYALRESLLFSYTPIMRGVITINDSDGLIIFDGLLNYYPIALFLWVIVLTIITYGVAIIFILMSFPFLLWVYNLQSKRYKNILNELIKSIT